MPSIFCLPKAGLNAEIVDKIYSCKYATSGSDFPVIATSKMTSGTGIIRIQSFNTLLTLPFPTKG